MMLWIKHRSQENDDGLLQVVCCRFDVSDERRLRLLRRSEVFQGRGERHSREVQLGLLGCQGGKVKMMKLGSQTGSMTNHLYSRMTNGQPKPEVGMGATVLSWSDREGATVVEAYEIKGGYEVVVQEDDFKRIDKNGMSECQDYEYTANPNARKLRFRFDDKHRGWREVYVKENGRVCLVKGGGHGLRIGERDKYHDFSF